MASPGKPSHSASYDLGHLGSSRMVQQKSLKCSLVISAAGVEEAVVDF